MYDNDFLNINCDGSMFCFADDTSIIVNDVNKNYIHNKSTLVLSTMKTWFDNNFLELNLSKTCFINFSINKMLHIENYYLKVHTINCFEYNLNKSNYLNSNYSKCNCTSIFFVQKVKYIGITIDVNLKWKYHIQNTAKTKVKQDANFIRIKITQKLSK